MTVDELIALLTKVSEEGFGHLQTGTWDEESGSGVALTRRVNEIDHLGKRILLIE